MFSLRWERYILAVIVVVVDIAGTSARAPQRVIGGNDAGSTEFPWQVSIRKFNRHHCGGAIIGKKHILTAGHCFDGQGVNDITVVAGTNTLRSSTGKTYSVKSFKVHDYYRSPLLTGNEPEHDIAVITLLREIKEDNYQKIIALPSEDVAVGVVGVVSGFGIKVDIIGTPLSETLQKFEFRIMGKADCLARRVETMPYEFCVDNSPGSGICDGDSGSPFVYNDVVVGIVSTSPEVCGSGVPDVYTRVFYYKDFITSVMENSDEQQAVLVSSTPQPPKLSTNGQPQQHTIRVTSPPGSPRLSGTGRPQQNAARVTSPPGSPKLSGHGRPQQNAARVTSPPGSPKLSSSGRPQNPGARVPSPSGSPKSSSTGRRKHHRKTV